jgi:hypothetical protein
MHACTVPAAGALAAFDLAAVEVAGTEPEPSFGAFLHL